MDRTEREMDLWRHTFSACLFKGPHEAKNDANDALKAFRDAFPCDPPVTPAVVLTPENV